ncbi:MAG: aminoglycoside phosphotransferase family protein, partial [Sphingobium sp.]
MATGEVPQTLARALDPQWLSAALAEHAGGVPVTHVETVEVIRTVATKVRFAATFGEGETRNFGLTGLLDVAAATARGGSTMVLEADFYGRVAGRVNVRVPDCVAAVIDRGAAQGVIIMRDLITGGAQFCSA